MSTLAENDPHRAIRNALERLRRSTQDSWVGEMVVEEAAIIEEAIALLHNTARMPDPFLLARGLEAFLDERTGELLFRPIRVRCATCTHRYEPSESVCPRCDLFAVDSER